MSFSLLRWMKTALPEDEKVSLMVHRLGPDEAERQALQMIDERERWVQTQDPAFQSLVREHGLGAALRRDGRKLGS